MKVKKDMNNSKKYQKIIFIVLIVIGIVARIINFPNAIPEMNCDEIMTVINANAIAETGKEINGISFPVYLLGWGGQSVVLVYLMALCFKIFRIFIIYCKITNANS